MPSLAEILKQAGVEEEVISQLPPKVVEIATGYVSSAESKLTEAQKAEENAREQLRIAGLERKEIDDYVAKYGADLTQLASLRADNEALQTYVKGLEKEGFKASIPALTAQPSPTAAVPGSPAIGGNATFDPKKFSDNVATFIAQSFDVNNEYQRLFGGPMPDSIETIAAEAQQARMSPREYAAKKYGFEQKKQERAAAEEQKKLEAAKTQAVEEFKRKQAEEMGSNPGLVRGQVSRNSVAPKIAKEEFHKSDGFVPARERRSRLLNNIHRDVAATRNG